MNQRDRFKELTAKKATTTPEPQPAQVELDELRANLNRKTDEFRLQQRSLKEAQDRHAAAEKKAANLEQTLIHVTETLGKFVMEQQRQLDTGTRSWLSDWQIEHVHDCLRIFTHPDQVALRLFITWPQIADTALIHLGMTEEDVAAWRRWYANYKNQDHDHWLNWLQDILDRKAVPKPGQEKFILAALEQDLGAGDVKKRLAATRDERIHLHEIQFPGPDYPLGAQIRRTYDK